MQQSSSEWDNTVPCSSRIILECGCGERLILLGLEEDWRSEQRTEFECSCGKGLNLSLNRLNEDVLAFRQLIRGARGFHRGYSGSSIRAIGACLGLPITYQSDESLIYSFSSMLA